MPIMSAFSCVQKFITSRQAFRVTFNILTCNTPATRTYADNPDSGKATKQTAAAIVVAAVTCRLCYQYEMAVTIFGFYVLLSIRQSKVTLVQGAENEDRLRVRRARPADVPRLMRFVREHAAATWPGLNVPPSASNLVLCDYVARALAQGHSLLAEHQESRRGWSQIRGLALGVSVCPWDPAMIERWARCIQCKHSRRLLNLTAYCLRAPLLHDKYGVHSILQVILIVPTDIPNPVDVAKVLAKNAIQRGRDVGFPVMRFDVTDKIIAQTLEDLRLTKEWQISYDSVPEDIKNQILQTKEKQTNNENEAENKTSKDVVKNIVVYTSVPPLSEMDGKVTMNKAI